MAKKTQAQTDRFDTLKVHLHAAAKLRTELGFADPREAKLVAVAGPMLGLIRPDGLGGFLVNAFPPDKHNMPTMSAATEEAAKVLLREVSNSHYDVLNKIGKPPAQIDFETRQVEEDNKFLKAVNQSPEEKDLDEATAAYIQFLDQN